MTTPFDQFVLSLSPVGYWPLSDTTGTAAVDVVSANNGTRVNTPTTGVDLVFPGGDVGFTFVAASSQRVTIPNSANYQFGTGDFSMMSLFSRTGDPATEENLVHRGIASAGGNGFEQYLGDGGAYLTSRIGAITLSSANPGWSWNTEVLAITVMDRDALGSIYINGALSNSTSIASEAAFSVSETATTNLGSSGTPDKYLTGGLAKVALFNFALSAAQVAAIQAARSASAPLPFFNAQQAVARGAW